MSKRTLLLADDSVTIQKVVNLTFADEGIDVVTVGDGDSAMEKISEIKPDVVLADVHMPGLTGYQICEIVRENPVTKDLPVVLLVGSFEPFDEGEAARVGANGYLTKPFQSIRQLVSQVTDLMDLSQPTPDPVIPQTDASEPETPQSFSPAQEPVVDTGDIDALYHQSFSDMPMEESQSSGTSQRYVDAGMDDEMIEANVVAAPQEMEAGDDLSSYDTEEDIEAPAVETREPEAYETPGEASGQSEESVAEAAEPVGANAFDTLAEDRGQVAAAASAGSEFDEFSRTEQIPAFDRTAPAGYARGDDSELLELPPIDSGKTLEFTTTQRMMAHGGRELVSISPELMDLIVEKVVEKLSEKY